MADSAAPEAVCEVHLEAVEVVVALPSSHLQPAGEYGQNSPAPRIGFAGEALQQQDSLACMLEQQCASCTGL